MGTKGKLTIIGLLMSGIVALLVWSKNGERKKTGLPAGHTGAGAVDAHGAGPVEPSPSFGDSADPMHAPPGDPPADDGTLRVETAAADPGSSSPDPRIAAPTPRVEDRPASSTNYTVAAGDSLWVIAKKVYGKGSEGRRIFEANRDKIASEDDLLRVGMVLTIPALPDAPRPVVPEVVDAPRPGGEPVSVAPAAVAAGAQKTYKVKAGDTLSSIAKTVLGDANKWTVIFKANKDRMSHPDTLTEGMELVIPQ